MIQTGSKRYLGVSLKTSTMCITLDEFDVSNEKEQLITLSAVDDE
jgi:hypothetical protein